MVSEWMRLLLVPVLNAILSSGRRGDVLYLDHLAVGGKSPFDVPIGFPSILVTPAGPQNRNQAVKTNHQCHVLPLEPSSRP